MRHAQAVPKVLLAAVIVGGLQLLACSSSKCVAGGTEFCSCPDGTQATQTCKPDGTFDACACGGTTGGSTSAGAGASSSGGSTTGATSGATSGVTTGATTGTAGSTTGPATSSGASATGGTTAGTGATSSGTSGGATGGNQTCSAPLDTPGSCSWPEFCVSGHCLAPQNMDSNGNDAPSLQCDISTPQGNGNLDDDRANQGIDPPSASSPIITDLQQVPIASDQDCLAYIGPGAKEYEESAQACAGGTVDDAGVAICASGEAAMLFQGGAFDPNAEFAGAEGTPLDAQFYWMTSDSPPVRFTDTEYGAVQSGFVIPTAGWSSAGGRFLMVHCLSVASYPGEVSSNPVTLHFADTGVGDAGIPGNSFCTDWSP